MADDLKVYLDHLVPRENLRYKRSEERLPDSGSQQAYLQIRDLMQDDSSRRARLLRKPDFQRASWSWSPEDCVSLLESLVNEQVIPSIIMWSSPETTLDYVLDGAHRVSVVLAWLKDDWGDNLPDYHDDEVADAVKRAATEVRRLIRQRVGTIQEYKDGDQAIEDAIMEGLAPKDVVREPMFKRGQFFRKLIKGEIHFHILWVKGNYEIAEQSFLKINKSGRQLLAWETKLIENRNSSFARAVMSIANITTAEHYWPSIESTSGTDNTWSTERASILSGIEQMNRLLFVPPYSPLVRSLRQPLLGAPETQQRPNYLAELLTVIEHGKGHGAETDALLSRDRDASAEDLIRNGYRLIQGALDAFSHIIGSSPKSLELVPALYYYTEAGRHVRSLLYGMLFWLLAGNDKEILLRKQLFSAYRRHFERVLLTHKADIIRRLTRNIGSGPEITEPTALFYQRLLTWLIEHRNNIQDDELDKAVPTLLTNPSVKRQRSTSEESSEVQGRLFTAKQKSQVNLRSLFAGAPRCAICGGILDIEHGGVQHDHIRQAAFGGPTSVENQRPVHPFCNNQRSAIELYQEGNAVAKLPDIPELDFASGAVQLSFINDLEFS
jgi:Protein of unknown function DUF262